MQLQPIKSGIALKCGRCGEGKLFGSYLKFKTHCDHCGQDFSVADTADGPPFFVGFLTMIVFAPFYFTLPLFKVALWVQIGLWCVLAASMAAFSLYLLPRFKGVLFNLQVRHRAEEAQFESNGSHGSPPRNWRG